MVVRNGKGPVGGAGERLPCVCTATSLRGENHYEVYRLYTNSDIFGGSLSRSRGGHLRIQIINRLHTEFFEIEIAIGIDFLLLEY